MAQNVIVLDGFNTPITGQPTTGVLHEDPSIVGGEMEYSSFGRNVDTGAVVPGATIEIVDGVARIEAPGDVFGPILGMVYDGDDDSLSIMPAADGLRLQFRDPDAGPGVFQIDEFVFDVVSVSGNVGIADIGFGSFQSPNSRITEFVPNGTITGPGLFRVRLEDLRPFAFPENLEAAANDVRHIFFRFSMAAGSVLELASISVRADPVAISGLSFEPFTQVKGVLRGPNVLVERNERSRIESTTGVFVLGDVSLEEQVTEGHLGYAGRATASANPPLFGGGGSAGVRASVSSSNPLLVGKGEVGTLATTRSSSFVTAGDGGNVVDVDLDFRLTGSLSYEGAWLDPVELPDLPTAPTYAEVIASVYSDQQRGVSKSIRFALWIEPDSTDPEDPFKPRLEVTGVDPATVATWQTGDDPPLQVTRSFDTFGFLTRVQLDVNLTAEDFPEGDFDDVMLVQSGGETVYFEYTLSTQSRVAPETVSSDSNFLNTLELTPETDVPNSTFVYSNLPGLKVQSVSKTGSAFQIEFTHEDVEITDGTTLDYRLWKRADLTAGDWIEVTGAQFGSSASGRTLTDPSAAASHPFYRVTMGRETP